MIILFLVSCKQTSDLPLVPSTDQFTFFFTSSNPNYISINDNTTGALIGTITPKINTEHVFQIPLNHKADTYTVSFIYDTSQSYFDGPVQVESFRDVKPTDYRIQNMPSTPAYTYRKLQYTPAEMIDSIHNRTAAYFRDGMTELIVKENEPPVSEVFIKLKGEDDFRYHYIDDLNFFSETEVSVTELPIVPEIKTVELDDNVRSGSVQMYLKQADQENWRLMGNYYHKHLENRSFSIPIIGNQDFIYHGYYFGESTPYAGSFCSKVLPEKLSVIDFEYELINGSLDQFEIQSVNSDIVNYKFRLVDYSQWNIIDDVSNGTAIKRPQFDSVVLEQFPSLGELAVLNDLTLTYMDVDNSIDYQKLIKPRRRILGFGFEFLNPYQGDDIIPYYQSVNIKL